MNLRKGLVLSAALVMTLGLFSCGKGNDGGGSFVKSVNTKRFVSEGEHYVMVTTQLGTGKMSITPISLPITHHSKQVGSVSIRSASSGAELVVNVNLSQAAGLGEPDGYLLPNGLPLPVGGVDTVDVFSFRLGGGNARFYLGLDDNVALVGVALTISAFDKVGKSVGPINIFPTFNFGAGKTGVAGIFAGKPGKSGIAFFVDATGAPIESESFDGDSTVLSKLQKPEVKKSSPFYFYRVKPSYWKEQNAYYQLYLLDRKRTRLHVR